MEVKNAEGKMDDEVNLQRVTHFMNPAMSD